MNEQECLEAVAVIGGPTASDLLYRADPKFEKRFLKLAKGLYDLMNDVHKHFPDASYYSCSGDLMLLLGSSHREEGGVEGTCSNHTLRAVTAPKLVVQGGDF